jgi:DinB superfamily
VTRAAIEQLLYLMDEAFDAEGHEHSFLANVRSVKEEDWHWVPPGGSRPTFEIVYHVGLCKYVYDNHAFGDSSMRWDRPVSLPEIRRDASREEVFAWLREGQRMLRGSVESLESDEELLKPRRSNWGQEYETRWLVSVMIEHDLYHAGEINHLRAMRQGDDRWAWETEEAG